jgi:hypothetical protein
MILPAISSPSHPTGAGRPWCVCGLLVFYHKEHTPSTSFVVELNRTAAIHDTGGMPKEPTVRTTVLLPTSLYERLKAIADAERRSTHKQIIYALEQFVSGHQPPEMKGGEK